LKYRAGRVKSDGAEEDGYAAMTQDNAKAIVDMLAWYEAMGVDAAVGDEPFDAFAAAHPPRRKIETAAWVASAANPSALTGRRLGEEVTTLAQLEALTAAFEGCALKRTAKSLCFKRGSDTARVMLIGEAPGRDEDFQGKPFVGRAGQLLDRMLAAIGLGEADVYITNTVYWRPPGNRTPSPEEIEACAPFLARQIELVAPKLLVLLGGAAAKTLLGSNEGIMRLRGKWLTYRSGIGELPVLATLHPAFLLRKPEQKRFAWRDLLLLKAKMDSL
jgi:uracil-DNA glycosylase family 4